MNYELAKELKDAGFPQTLLNIFDPNCKHEFHSLAHVGNCCGIYAPTLSELIEACGEKFGSLNRYGDIWDAEPPADDLMTGAWSGETPEEAVARLLLALNRSA